MTMPDERVERPDAAIEDLWVKWEEDHDEWACRLYDYITYLEDENKRLNKSLMTYVREHCRLIKEKASIKTARRMVVSDEIPTEKQPRCGAYSRFLMLSCEREKGHWGPHRADGLRWGRNRQPKTDIKTVPR
jgi:hypothetical protein